MQETEKNAVAGCVDNASARTLEALQDEVDMSLLESAPGFISES